jgi:hypothetical protein
MSRYYIGHMTVTALGFLTGALLAMSVAPGDTLLLVGTGIVFGFSARTLFDQDFGGKFWPFASLDAKKPFAAKPDIGHRQSWRVRR